MDKNLFSQKSISSLNSPDDLKDYIRVTNPGLWSILAAIIIFLTGICVWCVFGRIESKISVPTEVSSAVAVCSVEDPAELLKIEEGMVVEIGDVSGTVQSIDLANGTVTADISVADGSYTADIIKKSIAPITYITN